MFDRMGVRQVIGLIDKPLMKIVLCKGHQICYLCSDNNVGQKILKHIEEIGVYKTYIFVKIERVVFREEFVFVEYEEIEEGSRESISKKSRAIPYDKIEYIEGINTIETRR